MICQTRSSGSKLAGSRRFADAFSQSAFVPQQDTFAPSREVSGLFHLQREFFKVGYDDIHEIGGSARLPSYLRITFAASGGSQVRVKSADSETVANGDQPVFFVVPHCESKHSLELGAITSSRGRIARSKVEAAFAVRKPSQVPAKSVIGHRGNRMRFHTSHATSI